MRLVKIDSLPTKAKRWVDRDEVMLHACFQILVDCVEKENVDTHCNYQAHKEFVDEVRFLYKWWKVRKDFYGNGIDYDAEDDEMLMRLMEIRTALWT